MKCNTLFAIVNNELHCFSKSVQFRGQTLLRFGQGIQLAGTEYKQTVLQYLPITVLHNKKKTFHFFCDTSPLSDITDLKIDLICCSHSRTTVKSC